MRLKDRVVIVTGGASGIGKSISIKAAIEGARVVVADIRETPLEGGQNTVDAIQNSIKTKIFKFKKKKILRYR